MGGTGFFGLGGWEIVVLLVVFLVFVGPQRLPDVTRQLIQWVRQARRWVVYQALRNGAYFPWDFQPLQKASERYMRNHMDLNVLEDRQRFPRSE